MLRIVPLDVAGVSYVLCATLAIKVVAKGCYSSHHADDVTRALDA